jgi:hypothetical protein
MGQEFFKLEQALGLLRAVAVQIRFHHRPAPARNASSSAATLAQDFQWRNVSAGTVL